MKPRNLALWTLALALAAPALSRAHEGAKSPVFAEAASADDFTWAYGDLYGDDGVPTLNPWEDLDGYEYRASNQESVLRHGTRRVQIVVRRSMKERGYQFLTVSVDGGEMYSAPVSTAWERVAPGKTGAYRAYTPDGKFFPDGMQTKRFSNRWQVWLSNVIRFNNGIWIHATTPDHFNELGAPASGGCVRLHPVDAAKVYEIVERYGINDTAITVLPADRDEPQVPWKQQKGRPIPGDVVQWRLERGIL